MACEPRKTFYKLPEMLGNQAYSMLTLLLVSKKVAHFFGDNEGSHLQDKDTPRSPNPKHIPKNVFKQRKPIVAPSPTHPPPTGPQPPGRLFPAWEPPLMTLKQGTGSVSLAPLPARSAKCWYRGTPLAWHVRRPRLGKPSSRSASRNHQDKTWRKQ